MPPRKKAKAPRRVRASQGGNGLQLSKAKNATSNVDDENAAPSPIHRLPQEILESIFERVYFLGQESRRVKGGNYFLKHYTSWTTKPLWMLSAVCRSWRDIVQTACPRLWAHICTLQPEWNDTIPPDPPAILKRQKEFAKRCLLNVNVRFMPLKYSTPFSDLYESCSLWRRAMILFDEWDVEEGEYYFLKSQIMPLEAPELTYLRLCCTEGVRDDHMDGLFPFTLNAPKLKQVELMFEDAEYVLREMVLPWSQLTHLSLSCADIDSSIYCAHLVKDSIEYFSVLDFGYLNQGSEVADSEYEGAVPVILPKLHTLELRSWQNSFGLYDRLLSLITTPQLSSFTFHEEEFHSDYGEDVIGFLQRSGCKLRNLAIPIWKDECLTCVLKHTPDLLTLGLGGWKPDESSELIEDLDIGPDAERELCPLLEKVYAVDWDEFYVPKF